MPFSVYKKLGNFWVMEDEVTIAMCTSSVNAKRIRNALQKAESPAKAQNSAMPKLLKELRCLIEEATFDQSEYAYRCFEILEQLSA